MSFFFCFICLWVIDYVVFKLKHMKPNGPPVYYFFPFVGIAPFFFLPRSLFVPLHRWYVKNFPDVFVTRLVYPMVFAKNAAVQDVQSSEHCLSRSAQRFERAVGYLMTGRPTWFAFDHNDKALNWRQIRKTNLSALHVLPKAQKFERIAEVADHFLKTIDDQEGRLWDYVDDLAFAKTQETSNLNLGITFEENNIRILLKAMKVHGTKSALVVLVLSFIPLSFIKFIEPILPRVYRPTLVQKMYAKITRRFLEWKTERGDEPRDFVEAVLRLKKREAALDFLRQTGLLNILATTATTEHTTSAVLSYTSLNKSVQRKIHEELDRVVGSSPLSSDHLADLHYLKAALYEAGRLTPPIPMVLRLASAPARIGGYTTEANIRVSFSLISETMNATNFPNPDDFVPERFINDNGEFEDSKHFNIFSRGRRMCSGTDVANLSALISCAKIFQHFELIPERTDIEIPRYGGSFLADPAAIPLRFVRRKGSPKIRPAALKTGLTAFISEICNESSETK